jgi:hypothetical protein
VVQRIRFLKKKKKKKKRRAGPAVECTHGGGNGDALLTVERYFSTVLSW